MHKVVCPKCERTVPARQTVAGRRITLVPISHICVSPAAYESPAPAERIGLTRDMPATVRKG